MAGAGPLRERVTFRALTTGAGDGAGNYAEAWADIEGAKKVAASIAPLSQSEVVIPAGVQGLRLFEVVTRYSPILATIDVNDIMIDARRPTVRYNVKAPPINQDRHKRYLKFLVELGGAVG